MYGCVQNMKLWHNFLISQPILAIKVSLFSVFHTRNDNISKYLSKEECLRIKNRYETLILRPVWAKIGDFCKSHL